jgi:hypothetical protein
MKSDLANSTNFNAKTRLLNEPRLGFRVQTAVSWPLADLQSLRFPPAWMGPVLESNASNKRSRIIYVLIFASINGATCPIKILICSNSSAIGHK